MESGQNLERALQEAMLCLGLRVCKNIQLKNHKFWCYVHNEDVGNLGCRNDCEQYEKRTPNYVDDLYIEFGDC